MKPTNNEIKELRSSAEVAKAFDLLNETIPIIKMETKLGDPLYDAALAARSVLSWVLKTGGKQDLIFSELLSQVQRDLDEYHKATGAKPGSPNTSESATSDSATYHRWTR